MELDNNAHSVFLLYYHLVLVVKYRRQVFDETVSERSKEIFVYIAPKYNIMLRNGIMIKIMSRFYFGRTQIQKSANS